MLYRFRSHRRFLSSVLLATAVVFTLAVLIGARASATYARSTTRSAPAPRATQAPCTTVFCTFPLSVNPGLQPGKPFACPAIQQAKASITIKNRFAIDAQNDVMTLMAKGLPKKTAFDMFLVEHSAFDDNFSGSFGFGWYQSDLQSDAHGNVIVKVRGIFDKETFIENPNDLFTPIHTYNVGFWFNSQTDEQKVCGNEMTPPRTPFNGEQNAGLLAMITQGGPLQLVS
jgi:hypothetical protein